MGGGRRRRAHDSQTFLESVRSRLDRLDAVLLDLHWVTVASSWEPDSPTQFQHFESFGQTLTETTLEPKAVLIDEFA